MSRTLIRYKYELFLVCQVLYYLRTSFYVTSGTQLVVCVIISFLSCGYDSNHRDVINRTLCFFHLQGFDELMWSNELCSYQQIWISPYLIQEFLQVITPLNAFINCLRSLEMFYGETRKARAQGSNLYEAWILLKWSSCTSLCFLARILFGVSKYGKMN